MKRVMVLFIGMLFVGCFAGLAFAAATKADAESMVKKGIASIKENGKEKALAEFSNPKGQFVKGELYIFVVDTKGVISAHGANAKLIGKSMYDIKDAAGKLFMQEIINVGKKGSGWVEYQWTNPVSKKIEPKIAYVQGYGDMAVVCGIYKG